MQLHPVSKDTLITLAIFMVIFIGIILFAALVWALVSISSNNHQELSNQALVKQLLELVNKTANAADALQKHRITFNTKFDDLLARMQLALANHNIPLLNQLVRQALALKG